MRESPHVLVIYLGVMVSMVLAGTGAIIILRTGDFSGSLSYVLILFGYLTLAIFVPALLWVTTGRDQPRKPQQDEDSPK